MSARGIVVCDCPPATTSDTRQSQRLNPVTVPVVLAAIAGSHFLPYAWLQRTRVYVVLAVAIAIGSFAIQLVLGGRAFPFILFSMSLLYWIAAPILYRGAARIRARLAGVATA